MQQKLRVLHKTFFTGKIARKFTRSRIVTVFTKLEEIFYWEVKNVFFFTLFVLMRFVTSDVHFKADVVKKEEELSFSVDIEET